VLYDADALVVKPPQSQQNRVTFGFTSAASCALVMPDRGTVHRLFAVVLHVGTKVRMPLVRFEVASHPLQFRGG
jgi:hypothetical protein